MTERPEIFPGYFALAASFARVHEHRRRMAAQECPECEGAGCAECANGDDEPICSACSGSGEGMHDGTRCYRCKGSGVERPESGGDDYDEDAEDERRRVGIIDAL
jgi:hypothetical protein